ncbi:hypothetical protein [Actinomadura gamaensis]|uniref:Uncharacterized protein n=1 Tax=Actinomadura gamaensis TaxID=1763541 RepID=A0ABV9UB54_9ACTN
MPYPQISAGQRITASLLNSMLPATVVKSADQQSTSNALTNDPELLLPVVGGATYRGELVLFFSANVNDDLNYAWATPAGTVGRRGIIGPDPTATATVDLTALQDRVSGALNTQFRVGGAGGSHKMLIERLVVIPGATGTLQLQWGQGTGDTANPTTVYANSHLTLTRVA